MPVEIRELIIRAFVEPDNQKETKIRKDIQSNEKPAISSSEVIEQLLEIINNKNER